MKRLEATKSAFRKKDENAQTSAEDDYLPALSNFLYLALRELQLKYREKRVLNKQGFEIAWLKINGCLSLKNQFKRFIKKNKSSKDRR